MTDASNEERVSPDPSSAVLLAVVGLIWSSLYWGAAALVARGSGGTGFDRSSDWAGELNLLNGVAVGVAVCGLMFAVSSKPEVKVVLWILAAMAALHVAGVIYAFSVK